MYDKDQHIEELTTINEALVSRLADLNKRKMARNNEAANKWRNKCFYWKNKCESIQKQLEGKTDEGFD